MAIEDVLFPGIDVRVTAVHVTAERVAVEASSCGGAYLAVTDIQRVRQVLDEVFGLTATGRAGAPTAISSSLRTPPPHMPRHNCPKRSYA